MIDKTVKHRYMEEISRKIIVFDGAMGTGLQKQNLTERHFGGSRYVGCYDHLALSWPDSIETIHRAYLETGVDVIETNTFRSNRMTLKEYDLSHKAFEINRAAAELAGKVAYEFSSDTHPRFVAGSMGPTGFLPSSGDPDLGNIDFDTLSSVFSEQAKGLIAGGVDLLLIETSQDILEVKAAVHGILKAFEEGKKILPIQAQVTLDTTGRMLLGTDIETVLVILEGLPVDIIGINCSTGPDHMRTPAAYLCSHTSRPVSTIPNAGMPVNRGGEAFYPLKPEEFAGALEEFAKVLGVNIIGGCCGTTPDHLKALVPRVKDVHPKIREGSFPDALSSGIRTVQMKQSPAPLIIGERCNPQGSGAFKKLLLAEDLPGASETARAQVEDGAHALDLAAALSENRNEKERMARLVHRFTADGIDAPLVIDTTDPEVMEAALKTAPGKCLLNSTHLESGRDKADRVFSLAKDHNAAVMLLTIDEEGMAKTVERKLEIAERLYAMATKEHGLTAGSLVFDLLTFSLATGEKEYADSAVSTIRGITELKKLLPGVYTSLGVSNVSFGFGKTARKVLNSVFLYHAVRAGLDMAIVHASKIIPYPEIDPGERALAEDLIYNTREDAMTRYIEYFETRPEDTEGEDSLASPDRDLKSLLAEMILRRKKQGLKEILEELVYGDPGEHAGNRAVEIINDILLPAMKEVGDRFGRGEIILPFVLQSAEVMKEAVGLLEPYLEKGAGPSRGKIILATVAGDVHDIGKNLVRTILSNNGYTVIDLGKQVPVETIIEAIEKNNPDAVGLSALLVSTSLQMGLAVRELAKRKMALPVLIGGAAINQSFADEISLVDGRETYKGGVYYCRDAFESLNVLDALKRNTAPEDNEKEKSEKANRRENRTEAVRNQPRSGQPIRDHSRPVPEPPFLGYRRLDLPVREIAGLINKRQLFSLSWGAGKAEPEKKETILAEFETRFAALAEESVRNRYIVPRALYGFFPVLADGDDLVVFSPENPLSGTVLERFHFPAEGSGHPSIARGFRTSGSCDYDIAMFQIVTCGREATERFDRLQEADRYTEAFYFHGFSVQAAEAAAEYVFSLGMKQLGLQSSRVRRISWGYPAAPDLSEHDKVFHILPAVEELGMELTSAFQFIPEQSTAAMMAYRLPGRND